MSSVRTIIRDRIVAEFLVLAENGSGRVPEFDVSLRWLSPDETKRAATYCVIVTDESRAGQTLEQDAYQVSGAVVLYAHDTKDARGKMDLMIEDAIEVLRQAFRVLTGVIQTAVVESVTTTEASTAEQEWPQAVIRWTALHRRAVMV
jgi:hypothetical protein